MLEVGNLNVRFGATDILRGVHFSVPKGAIVGLIGRNGAGKTTTLRAIMGLVKPNGGTLTFDGVDLVKAPSHERTSLGIGYAPEDRRLIPDMTVEENLCVPAWALKAKDVQERLDKVYGIIPEAREWAPRRALQLSGGQQKLVAVGRALMTSSRLLMLDEPFEGVAPALSKRIAEVIGQMRGAGLAVILSGADLQHAGAVLDNVYRIDRGQMVASV
ncbi:ABC transporter ATP-binding protein [Pandoraea apista]|uniref:ABC transporter ATP-binding protein n=1 Tax=Pandoraea apista TaxID=93218 RepID=A0A0B5FAU7_9BURK|nr:ABC transporter ATP-binding protein [Pandoraea apista]AJE97177.1 ABC transporter ATP-binding protein [Pandoraea apista]AKH71135.1 ABC transporter ATP-binding protein [Pandoraea apista]AKI63406.1 ABC transporter ATP-binding protein [Pandoraea apista]ALS67487.1 ABC transporter ATP-binding protein [Pandoraea apista]AVF41781.1 ABC transporter ATP-binding protein [Pandoraea apista]